MATGKIVLAEGYFANAEKVDVTYDVIYVKSAFSIEMDELTDEISHKFVGKLANGGRMVISGISELLVVDKDEDGRITKATEAVSIQNKTFQRIQPNKLPY